MAEQTKTEEGIGTKSGISVCNLSRDAGNPSCYAYRSYHEGARQDTVLVDLGRYESPDEIDKKYNTITPDIRDILVKENPAALFLTHMHSDHVDGIYEYVLQRQEAEKAGKKFPALPPIVCSPSTRNWIINGLDERGISEDVLTFIDIVPGQTAVVENGEVKVYKETDEIPHSENALVVTANVAPHSVPDSLSFTFETPDAKVFHSGDFRPDSSSTLSSAVAQLQNGQGVMRVYDERVDLPSGCDMVVMDCGSGNIAGNAPTEESIYDKYVAELSKESRDTQVGTVIQNNHIERLFSAVKAGIDAGRPVIIDGGSEMDKHLLAVLQGVKDQAGEAGKNITIDDLFAPLQKPGQPPVPVVYRSANSQEDLDTKTKTEAALAFGVKPFLVTTGLYTVTDDGSSFYAALRGDCKKDGTPIAFPIDKDARIYLTDSHDCLKTEEIEPLKALQIKVSGEKTDGPIVYDSETMKDVTLGQLPHGIRMKIEKRDKPWGKPASWENPDDMKFTDLPEEQQKIITDSLKNTPDVRRLSVDVKKEWTGPGHACAQDIKAVTEKTGGYVYNVHANHGKKRDLETILGKTPEISTLTEKTAGDEIFISHSAPPPQVVAQRENQAIKNKRDSKGVKEGEPQEKIFLINQSGYPTPSEYLAQKKKQEDRPEVSPAERMQQKGKNAENAATPAQPTNTGKQPSAEELAKKKAIEDKKSKGK